MGTVVNIPPGDDIFRKDAGRSWPRYLTRYITKEQSVPTGLHGVLQVSF